ncbi:flagellar hook-associated family protein [Microvirga roseola]|uniref:flagellar hook-associated family protein n=1 Tax=Microvirga roseola TaxID=2883126 RepID=UPI001E4A9E89|nr:flagellar hook-associated family protein [Microvirga roseola]
MKTTFISTATLWSSPRSTLDKLQGDLVKANKELVTGRETDVGLKLGYRTGEAISLRQERSELESIIDSNATVKVRLEASSAALARVRQAADDFMSSLIATPTVERNMAVVKSRASSNLNDLVANLNTAIRGQYIFGGINTSGKPVGDYAAPSAAKTAIDAAFAAFPAPGFAAGQDDPAVATITPADMEAFLDGPFKALFEDPNWGLNWSSASNRNIESLISPSDKIASSANANEKAFRDLAMAYTMTFDLGIGNMNDDTREVVVNRVIGLLSGAVTAVSDIETNLGIAKEKLEEANTRMDLQKTIFEEKLVGLEGVDPAEAKVRVDQLMTQIQTSFSLTSQLRQLNLINFL